MKISRMIELLEKVKENHGDVEVVAYNRIDEANGFVKKVTFADSEKIFNNYYYKCGSVTNDPCCVIECQ